MHYDSVSRKNVDGDFEVTLHLDWFSLLAVGLLEVVFPQECINQSGDWRVQRGIDLADCLSPYHHHHYRCYYDYSNHYLHLRQYCLPQSVDFRKKESTENPSNDSVHCSDSSVKMDEERDWEDEEKE